MDQWQFPSNIKFQQYLDLKLSLKNYPISPQVQIFRRTDRMMCMLTCSVSTKDQFFSNMSSKESATLRRNRQNNLKKKILLPLVFSYIFLNGKLCHSTSEAHPLPSQIPKLELFAKMFEGDLNMSLLSSVILKYNFINCNYSN